MKQKSFIQPIAMGVAIGTAMSVALNDNAVGWAIGFGVAIAFGFGQRKKNSEEQ